MNAKKLLTTITSLILCLIIITSSIALIAITALRSTIFKDQYYLQLVESDTYLSLMINAIKADVSAQSSYVAIPAEVLLAGFNEKTFKMNLTDYMFNTFEYLNYTNNLRIPEYPSEVFIPALKDFLQSDAITNNYIPSAEQYTLLDEVAKDTALIIDKHTNLFQMNILTQIPIFNDIHRKIYNISNYGPIILFIWLVAILLLSVIHLDKIFKWLFYLLTSFWLVGSTILVPLVILNSFNLVQRLLIETQYIKYASDVLLSSVINAFITPALLLFLLSTIGLVAYAYRNKTYYRL